MCTENEFSSATMHSAGANPFDVLESFDDVQALKEHCDYVVVLYHGGKEFYRYPSPMLQRYCRKFIEKGASLVLCQHSHCIGRTWVIKAFNLICNRKLIRLLLGTTSYLAIQNYLSCEAHHELFLQGIKNINRN